MILNRHIKDTDLTFFLSDCQGMEDFSDAVLAIANASNYCLMAPRLSQNLNPKLRPKNLAWLVRVVRA